MRLKKFIFVITTLRFDDPSIWVKIIENGDKQGQISEILHLFISNCQSIYSPSEYLIVDEILIGFGCCCHF